MEQIQKYFLAFASLPEVGPARFKKIINGFASLVEAWQSNASGFIKAGIEPKISEKICISKNSLDPEKEFEKLQSEDIKIIPFPFKKLKLDNQSYPKQLAEIKSAPFILFCKGNLDLLNKKQIAVVGSRKPTAYGKQVAEKIIPELCRAGLVITSGLAIGTDSIAHKIALESEGPTIAVLGNGLGRKVVGHSGSFNLFSEIIQKDGLIVSEYPPEYEANKFTFPARNRIISGLSLGTLIIEAGEKSGTLITANYALEQNREVFAVPGNIFSPQSAGTHQIIKQGAAVTTCAEDILSALNFSFGSGTKQETAPVFESELEKLIYQQLSFDPIQIDKLAKICKVSVSEISTVLSILELKGCARNIGGGRFVRN